jgi:hypothetical protein
MYQNNQTVLEIENPKQTDFSTLTLIGGHHGIK